MDLASCTCNVCGGDDSRHLATQRGYRVVRCRRCGLVYLNPRPPSERILDLYATYHARNGGDAASWDRLMRRVFRESADLLCASSAGSGRPRLMDVGCGFGGFVGMMQGRGWDAEGVDPSPAVVEAAQRNGRRVRLGALGAVGVDHGVYDAVTMFYVLEHLPDPMRALRTLWNVLKPEGTILIRVPHTTPIVRLLAPVGLGGTLYDPPFHLYDFSPAVLRGMLGRTGFVDVRTFPGKPTVPSRFGPRAAALFFGMLASGLHRLTRGTVLLPGVSKTTIARKPAR